MVRTLIMLTHSNFNKKKKGEYNFIAQDESCMKNVI